MALGWPYCTGFQNSKHFTPFGAENPLTQHSRNQYWLQNWLKEYFLWFVAEVNSLTIPTPAIREAYTCGKLPLHSDRNGLPILCLPSSQKGEALREIRLCLMLYVTLLDLVQDTSNKPYTLQNIANRPKLKFILIPTSIFCHLSGSKRTHQFSPKCPSP